MEQLSEKECDENMSISDGDEVNNYCSLFFPQHYRNDYASLIESLYLL
jgi:hypothetical protein